MSLFSKFYDIMWRFNEVIPDFKNLNIRVHQNVKSDNNV